MYNPNKVGSRGETGWENMDNGTRFNPAQKSNNTETAKPLDKKTLGNLKEMLKGLAKPVSETRRRATPEEMAKHAQPVSETRRRATPEEMLKHTGSYNDSRYAVLRELSERPANTSGVNSELSACAKLLYEQADLNDGIKTNGKTSVYALYANAKLASIRKQLERYDDNIKYLAGKYSVNGVIQKGAGFESGIQSACRKREESYAEIEHALNYGDKKFQSYVRSYLKEHGFKKYPTWSGDKNFTSKELHVLAIHAQRAASSAEFQTKKH